MPVISTSLMVYTKFLRGWWPGFGTIHMTLKNIRLLVGILEISCLALRLVQVLSDLGLTSTIHLNSSTIFLIDKLHRSFWSFFDNTLELSFFVSSTHMWRAMHNAKWAFKQRHFWKRRVSTCRRGKLLWTITFLQTDELPSAHRALWSAETCLCHCVDW